MQSGRYHTMHHSIRPPKEKGSKRGDYGDIQYWWHPQILRSWDSRWWDHEIMDSEIMRSDVMDPEIMRPEILRSWILRSWDSGWSHLLRPFGTLPEGVTKGIQGGLRRGCSTFPPNVPFSTSPYGRSQNRPFRDMSKTPTDVAKHAC